MLSELSLEVVEYMLINQYYGRIGFSANNRVLIEPVMYHYDSQYIYGYTREGTKTEMLRQNPNVCFEIDEISSPGVWRSVVIEGYFEELQGDDRDYAVYVLGKRRIPLFPDEVIEYERGRQSNTLKIVIPVVYRIKVLQKTGRSHTFKTY